MPAVRALRAEMAPKFGRSGADADGDNKADAACCGDARVCEDKPLIGAALSRHLTNQSNPLVTAAHRCAQHVG
jgi:hypothetical protein